MAGIFNLNGNKISVKLPIFVIIKTVSPFESCRVKSCKNNPEELYQKSLLSAPYNATPGQVRALALVKWSLGVKFPLVLSTTRGK